MKIIKHLFRRLLRLLFGFRADNESVLGTNGPVLLIPNHVSWVDWLFLGVCLEEDWRFVTSSTTAQTSWLHRRIMINRYTFPIDTASPYAVKRMAEFLQGGGRLVLFAEGRLSLTGTLMKLFDGTGFLLFKTRAKVITCYLRGAQRLPFSPHPGWKKCFPRVSAHFSGVLVPPKLEHLSTARARQESTQWLREKLIEQQFAVEMDFGPNDMLAAIVETARQQPRRIVLEDATSQKLSYRRLLAGAQVLARQWQTLLRTSGERIGILLPNVNATPVLLLSLWAIDKVPAVLNFSTGMATMLACARLAGLKQIITSKTFLDRAKLKAEPFMEEGLQLIYLEDVRQLITGWQKFSALLKMTFRPGSLSQETERRISADPPLSRDDYSHEAGRGRLVPASWRRPAETCGHKRSPPRFQEVQGDPAPSGGPARSRSEQSAVVLFTSGSEGVPKGVELTHANLLANIRQMLAMTDLQDTDRIFNCLPLFHSFGLTVGTLLPLVRGMFIFIYPSPLHYRLVPTVFYHRNCTVLLSTNTFLNGYARKAHPYDFHSLRYLFAGAEKLQESTAACWAQRFGVRIFEGYGATECSPCLSLNTPLGAKHGSAGRLMPGLEFRLEPVEGVTEGGRLFVRGPNIMRGYLNSDANEKFKALGGWYDTGDIVSVDAEGYVHILGRLKRFAKVSGEMVSLTAVEDALAGAFPHYGLRCQVAVLARSDAEKGEALIAVTNEPKLRLDEIRAAIKGGGLTNLCVPREVKFVREIPKLGTGKVNHRELARMI